MADLMIRLGMLVGGFFGFAAGVQAAPDEPRACDGPPADCIGDSFTDQLAPIALYAMGGVLLGALAASLLCRLLMVPASRRHVRAPVKASRSHARTGSSPARRSQHAGPRQITARHAGSCAGCSAPIRAGDRIMWNPFTRVTHCQRCGSEA